MRLKEHGNVVIATILVITLFLGLIGAGWYLFQWLGETEPLKADAQVASPTHQTTPSEDVTRKSADMRLAVSQRVQTHKTELDPTAIEIALAAGYHLHDIGSTAWSDSEYAKLTELLKANPEIRKHLALEFRINTDPKKTKRLAAMLGQFDDDIITDVGLELALSGEHVSQKSGLTLLGKQQPHNIKARSAIADILQVETTPDILVSALNAVAVPPKVNVTHQQELLTQFENLSHNEDANVRSHSMAMMARWAGKTNVNQYLLQGLNDSDPSVRKTAAYSLMKSRYLTDDVKQQLLTRTQDESELKRTREAALLALERFNLSDNEQQHLNNIRRNIQQRRNSTN